MSTTSTLARRTMSQSPQHIAILGATGGTGLAMIQEHLAIPETPSKPYLTLYTRPSGRSKLTPILPQAISSSTPAPRIRIIEGSLSDKSAVRTALSPDPSFPKVTTVISVLGAYVSLYRFLTRTKTPTPITDAFNGSIVPTMREMGIRRILALSTFAAFPVAGEKERMSWGWYFFTFLPSLIVPQGHAEMKGIANAVLENQGGVLKKKEGLDATVVRVPMIMNQESADLEVRSFLLGGEGATDNKSLSKGSLARWLLREVERAEWDGRAPVVCNTGKKDSSR